MKKKLVLSLGSNLGNRYVYLLEAKNALEKIFASTSELAQIYTTLPWGDTHQPTFLNTAMVLETDLQPCEVLFRIQGVEETMGKKKLRKWGPRCIDIDIIFLGESILDSEQLIIPHKYAHERAFVLAPLVDIVPHMIHPRLGQSVSDLFNKVLNDTTIFE